MAKEIRSINGYALKDAEARIIVTTDTDATTATLELLAQTDYRYNKLQSLTVTLPSTVSNTFESALAFSSGSTATAFTYPDNIKWSGTDVVDGVFVPTINTRYNICFWSDDMYINAIVRGIDI